MGERLTGVGSVARRGRRVWSRWCAEAVAPRLQIVRLVPEAGGGLVTALVIVNVVLGLLPVGFVIATSMVIGGAPAPLAGGVGSAVYSGLGIAFLVAAVLFVSQQALAPAQMALGEMVRCRVDACVQGRVMAVALRSTGVGPLEDPEARDALELVGRELRFGWQTPGRACAGLLALIARYVQLVGFVMVVAAAGSVPSAVALLVVVLVFRYGNRGGLRRYARTWVDIAGLQRRTTYLRDLAIGGSAAKELRVFGLVTWLNDRLSASYFGWLVRVWRDRRRIYLYQYLGYTALGLAGAAVVFVTLAAAGTTGDITLVQMAAALQAAAAATALGQSFPEADVQIQFGMTAMAGIQRLQAVVDRVDTTAHRSATSDATGLPQRHVRFERVSFRYPGGAVPLLDELQLDLPQGRCTAVVGANGAGKTTLVKLLARLHEPTAGTIRVDGVDIRDLAAPAWRAQLSVVFQDFVRYELSGADNIAFGAVQAPRDEEAIRRAAAEAGVLEVFEHLPRGLDTPLHRAYPDGIDLSGGQWQRIAIARSLYALAAGARVLVLDEPTAALDVRAEARFFDEFVAVTRGATALLISHRFSSVRRADCIVVLEHGRVVEQGDHNTLMAADGRYADMFRLQAGRFASAS